MIALLTTAAHSDDRTIAEGITTMWFYHRNCAKLPADKMAEIGPLLKSIPNDVLFAAMERVNSYYKNVGTAKFCEIWKTKIGSVLTK